MDILIVEGNTADATASLQEHGLTPYSHGFAAVLQSLSGLVECDIAYPCEREDGGLPRGRSLTDYDGICWTGSSLCLSDGSQPAVARQLELARSAFDSGVPVFGSCWGMQLMAVALGGAVRLCARGREIGITRHVQLSQDGRGHPLYQAKAHCFDAIASHRDEVIRLPADAKLLAGNLHSPIQAFAIERGDSSFWGVQYHPEFDLEIVAALMTRRQEDLIEEGFFRTEEEVHRYVGQLREIYNFGERREAVAWQLGITADILDPAIRHRELVNWLHLKLEVPGFHG